jgi:hypothetical protein
MIPKSLRLPKTLTASAIALCLGFAQPASAQTRFLFGPGAEFIGVGISKIETSELNDRLIQNGYPDFERTPLALNLGAHRILRNRLMLGAEWHGVIHDNKRHEGREVGLGGGYGTLSLGYAFELSPRVRVYPRLGFGGGGMGLWMQTPQDTVAFDDVLNNPETHQDRAAVDSQTTLNTNGAVVDIGAGAEFLTRRSGRVPMIGIRLGYVAMPNKTNWRQFDRPISGGPRATLGGPYIRVIVGTARSR